MSDFFEDLSHRRGIFKGGTPFDARIVELNGGQMVHLTQFEPDPATFRDEYYYNTVRNVLYKKSQDTVDGFVVATWKKVSN